MKVYDAAAIRNVALVGHGGSGKTQLASAMLFASGAVNRLGKVDDGTTTTVVDDAVHGVEVQTEKLWAEAAALNLPRIVVVNKLDRERASLDRALESLHRDCAREVAPIQLPLGEEKAFTGVIDLVRMKAQMFGGDGKMTEGDIPSSLADAAQH